MISHLAGFFLYLSNWLILQAHLSVALFCWVIEFHKAMSTAPVNCARSLNRNFRLMNL